MPCFLLYQYYIDRATYKWLICLCMLGSFQKRLCLDPKQVRTPFG